MDTNRVMFAQALFNLAGQPNVAVGANFIDVAPTDWYAPAATWANNICIVQGYRQ